MPMWTGTPAEFAAAEQRAARLAQTIVDLLADLDTIHPGSTSGRITFIGGEIVNRGGVWTVRR